VRGHLIVHSLSEVRIELPIGVKTNRGQEALAVPLLRRNETDNSAISLRQKGNGKTDSSRRRELQRSLLAKS
jgi:hypothetical protein